MTLKWHRIILSLTLLVILCACDSKEDKYVAQCSQNIEHRKETDTSILTQSLDAENYCRCAYKGVITDKALTRENHSRCMMANARAGLIRNCEEKLAPLVRQKADKTLDCGCFINHSSARISELFINGTDSLSEEAQQALDIQNIEVCTQ